ncbi:MAG: hypothetical protein AB2660_17600 [Candidatus Thiodiazotropha sp.]
MDKTVTDTATGESYSLEHLKPFQVTYSIKVNGEPKDVTLHVHFSKHCYTRSRKEGDPDNAVLYREEKRRGDIDERVFCKARWEFSKSLPTVIRELHSKGCLLSRRQQGNVLPARRSTHEQPSPRLVYMHPIRRQPKAQKPYYERS